MLDRERLRGQGGNEVQEEAETGPQRPGAFSGVSTLLKVQWDAVEASE